MGWQDFTHADMDPEPRDSVICKDCGEEFIPPRNGDYEKFCSRCNAIHNAKVEQED